MFPQTHNEGFQNKRGYAPFKTHMVHFYISFENLASSATQGFIFLENQCTFLENKKLGKVARRC